MAANRPVSDDELGRLPGRISNHFDRVRDRLEQATDDAAACERYRPAKPPTAPSVAHSDGVARCGWGCPWLSSVWIRQDGSAPPEARFPVWVLRVVGTSLVE